MVRGGRQVVGQAVGPLPNNHAVGRASISPAVISGVSPSAVVARMVSPR